MKVTKTELTKIFDAAKANFMDLDKSDMDSQQFNTLCYMKAAASILKLDLEFTERIFAEPIE